MGIFAQARLVPCRVGRGSHQISVFTILLYLYTTPLKKTGRPVYSSLNLKVSSRFSQNLAYFLSPATTCSHCLSLKELSLAKTDVVSPLHIELSVFLSAWFFACGPDGVITGALKLKVSVPADDGASCLRQSSEEEKGVFFGCLSFSFSLIQSPSFLFRGRMIHVRFH